MGVLGVSILCIATPFLIFYFVPLRQILSSKALVFRKHDSQPPPRIETTHTPTMSSDMSSGTANGSISSDDSTSAVTLPSSTTSTSNSSTLMAPPPRPTTLPPVKPPPTSNSTSSLRVPSNGPLPNRNPNAAARSSTLLVPTTKASLNTPNNPNNTSTSSASSLNPGTTSSKPRQKVLLSPGHSPLDWAHLTRSGRNLSGVPSPQKVTPSQLSWHNGRKGRPAWAAWKGRVYNITEYLPFHPGGEGELMRAAGKYGEVVEKLFLEVHPWVNWENMLGACWVGWLVEEQKQ